MLLDQLLSMIPSDTEERVRRTRDRFNQNIREAIRQETGLRFRPRSRAGDLQPAEFIGVPVRLVAGLPKSLKKREVDDRWRIAALLAPWRRTLEQLRNSSTVTAERVVPIVRDLFLMDAEAQLRSTAGLAEDLLQRMQGFDLAKWILDINEDVLVLYCCDLSGNTRPDKLESHIELYWGVIGLFGQILGVSPEALTIVVLAHELGHAYTHRAADIDGRTWDSVAFGNSDRPLIEGLAQYYAARTCERLIISAPEAGEAYKELLKHQPESYKKHVRWLEKHRPEEVRFALVVARREGEMKLERFETQLKAARWQLRGDEAAKAEAAEAKEPEAEEPEAKEPEA